MGTSYTVSDITVFQISSVSRRYESKLAKKIIELTDAQGEREDSSKNVRPDVHAKSK